jgi:hypothetical protein
MGNRKQRSGSAAMRGARPNLATVALWIAQFPIPHSRPKDKTLASEVPNL